MTRGQWDRSHLRLPERERIERHIDKTSHPDGCWLWTGALAMGYGVTVLGFKAEGTQRKAQVHRLMYEWFVGPIPPGLHIDHLCRVRRCCNPSHLEPVTQRENLLRGETIVAMNAAKTHCKWGHPFDEANTRMGRNGRARNCRACDRKRAAAARAARAIEAIL